MKSSDMFEALMLKEIPRFGGFLLSGKMFCIALFF
jgi:hypothetical protein